MLQNNPLKNHFLIFPYVGPKSNTIIKTINVLKRILLDNESQIHVKKLGAKFQIKDKSIDQHKHEHVYYSKCPEATCNKNFTAETGRRMIERSTDHCCKDKKIRPTQTCIEQQL